MALFNKLNKPIFLKEESDVKYYILKLNELYNNSPEHLKNKIEKEIKLATLGEFGEKNIAFELKNSGIPMYIIHDVCLEFDGLAAQIDYIVVTRKVTFIIECKNLIGNIEIDSQGNFIRTYNFNKRFIKEGIYSPITQNERHINVIKQIGINSKRNIISKALFEKYFNDNYKSIVVLSNPKTILNSKYAKKEIKDKVIRSDQLNNYIKEVNNRSNTMSLNDDQMKNIAERLLSLHKPNNSYYLKKYGELIEDCNKNNEEIISKETIENSSDLKDIVKELNIKDNDSNINDTNNSNISSNSKHSEVLIKVLKDFRLKTSREENTKPYIIFSDKQMHNLLEKMPKTKEELKEVSGFGDVKVEKYGDDILKIINK